MRLRRIRLSLIAGFLTIGGAPQAAAQLPPVKSQYITMRDGVRIAIDVWIPSGPGIETRLPTTVQFTRYWRSFKTNRSPRGTIMTAPTEYFARAGYAVAIVDVRGTGASFGVRETEWSDTEVQDIGEVIDWIARQPWSNGRVATIGTSYGGNTAELAAIPARPALRAIVPRFSDFTEYEHAFRPGGVRNDVIAASWVQFTVGLDANDGCAAIGAMGSTACQPPSPWAGGVKPVDEDPDGKMLADAIREHAKSRNPEPMVDALEYSDDSFDRTGRPAITLDAVSPSRLWPQIDRARVPALHWASWFDGGTASGVLTRFINYRTPLRVIIGAWNHGAEKNADPYVAQGDVVAIPAPGEQFATIQRFLDPFMKGEASSTTDTARVIEYLTIGANRWRTTTVWPPKGSTLQRYYFQAGNSLGRARPAKDGSDRYQVDFTTTTGDHNRWKTQLGTYLNYPDRREQDAKLLTYTSAPLDAVTEITGDPVVRVQLESTQPDGALFVYLEDEAPDGRVTYLTDGVIRLSFNGEGHDPSGRRHLGPVHTFSRNEARPIKPGETVTVAFALNPISIELAAGHRIRIALAGADAGTFGRLPPHGEAPVLTIKRGTRHASWVELPVVR